MILDGVDTVCYLVQARTTGQEDWENIAMTGGENAREEAERTVRDAKKCVKEGKIPQSEYRIKQYKRKN